MCKCAIHSLTYTHCYRGDSKYIKIITKQSEPAIRYSLLFDLVKLQNIRYATEHSLRGNTEHGMNALCYMTLVVGCNVE